MHKNNFFVYVKKRLLYKILLDKKLKEICITMGKSETNINSVRSHIRKKLGLSANEVLKDALESRIKTKNVF